MQLCGDAHSLKCMCLCSEPSHIKPLHLYMYVSLCDQYLHLFSCYSTINLKTGTTARGRKGKQIRHPLNMRVNHNWFALVTVELVDRCRRGVCGAGCGEGGGEDLPTGGGGMSKRRRYLGCVSSCVYQKMTHKALLPKSVFCMVVICLFGNFGE